MTADVSILVLGTADWDQPIATNQHYMTRELSKDYRTIFVESLGLRRLEMTRRDVSRVIKRIRTITSYSRVQRDRPPNVRVFSPLMLPLHGGPCKALNGLLLNRLVREWLNHTGTRILWTYSPVTYGLEEHAHAAFYHSVDLLGEVPGISRHLIDASEADLARQGIQSIGSSEVVVAHLRDRGFVEPLLWPNVADVLTIERARIGTSGESREPRAVFAGNLSETKIDFELLRRVLMSGVDLHLAGPISEGGGDAAQKVKGLVAAGATYHGMLPIDDLARVYWNSTVGLIPYQLNSYTVGVSPLKTFEYLAAGLCVVSTPIPSVQTLENDVLVGEDSDSFVRMVMDKAEKRSSPGDFDRRNEIARRNSWQSRGQQARDLIAAAISAI